MEPSVDPSDGAPDSKRSESTFPFDTGEFGLRRSVSLRWVALGVVLAATVGGLGFVQSFHRSNDGRAANTVAPANPRADAARAADAEAARQRQACLDLAAKVQTQPASAGTPLLD